ncbi:tetratricopeptide repeat protein [Massilia sp. Dwa41.01b]|uniref:tetratricopeptide repeat protein n=1 Tax=Massilia sp. Dwa41.01b TaxID=2709302 RepID=UPI001E3A9D96|nr:tetratricopeptide repeat protein [Massilia sp. Dwa41.01b]
MRILSLILCACLAGCAGTMTRPAEPSALAALLDDSAFPAPGRPADASDLFTLSPAMKAHLRSHAFQAKLREKGAARGLVNALYTKSDLQLDYDATVTQTAAQTYAARSGNCLSLVIMTAAFARELGMKVRFQSVEAEDTWSRTTSLYLVSEHVNISLAPAQPLFNTYAPDSELTIDFLASRDASRLRTRELEEADIVALYMNNRAAEEMLQGRHAQAYWWARAALLARPGLLPAYNTLAVIYQRSSRPLQAERVYRAALERDPDSLVVMQNLAPLLAANGKPAEAQQLNERIARLYPAPPFHYFNQGMDAYRAGDFARARALFAREVARAPYNDEFHFWLGLAHMQLGEMAPARKQLALARDTSVRADSRTRYTAKLEKLRGLSAASGPSVH